MVVTEVGFRAEDVGHVRNRVFEKLKLVARKGYPLALLWGDDKWRPPPDGVELVKAAFDNWEFSNNAILGVTDFTFGLFPDGVP